MGDKHYIISEISQITGLEPHVLRYWEDELELNIPRNSLGHRYYTDEHVQLFSRIREMKEKGYQLKAIKSELFGIMEEKTQVSVAPDKMEQFKSIISGIVNESLRDNNVILEDELTYKVSDKVIKEMDYLLRLKEEAEEERYKKLDETIRNCQRSGKEAAAGLEGKNRKKRKKFRRVK